MKVQVPGEDVLDDPPDDPPQPAAAMRRVISPDSSSKRRCPWKEHSFVRMHSIS